MSVQNQLSLEFTSPLEKGELALCERARDRVPALVAARRHLEARRTPRAAHDPVAEAAQAHGVSPQQVALAWLLSLSPVMIPIPGASRPESIQDSVRAAGLRAHAATSSTRSAGSPRACTEAPAGAASVRLAKMQGMARSMWSGAISFGLVNVPIKLYSAVSRKTVRFHQLNGETGQPHPAEARRPGDGRGGGLREHRQGLRAHADRYVVIKPEELEALDPEKSRTIDIEDFVDLAEIDPVYYDHPYYLVPDKGAAKAYGLLLDAMQEAGKVAIARVVLRSKEQLVAIRPTGRPAADDGDDDLRRRGRPAGGPRRPAGVQGPQGLGPRAEDGRAADRVTGQRSSTPTRYHDEYREKVLELIEPKAQGEEIVVQPEAPKAERVPDLMAALEASLAAVRGGDDDGDKPKKKSSSSSKRETAKT